MIPSRRRGRPDPPAGGAPASLRAIPGLITLRPVTRTRSSRHGRSSCSSATKPVASCVADKPCRRSTAPLCAGPPASPEARTSSPTRPAASRSDPHRHRKRGSLVHRRVRGVDRRGRARPASSVAVVGALRAPSRSHTRGKTSCRRRSGARRRRAGTTFGWAAYVGTFVKLIGMKTFGASGVKALQTKFGFKPERVVRRRARDAGASTRSNTDDAENRRQRCKSALIDWVGWAQNMVRRLLRGGHTCAVHDTSRPPCSPSRTRARSAPRRWGDSSSASRSPASSADGAGGVVMRPSRISFLSRARRHRHRRRELLLP